MRIVKYTPLKKSKKGTKKVTLTVSKRKPAVSSSVKAYVRKALIKAPEKKFSTPWIVTTVPISSVNPSYTIYTNNNIYQNALNGITQGVAQNQRVGNQITITKLILKVILTCTTNTLALCEEPFIQQGVVDTYIIYKKDGTDFEDPPYNFYQIGATAQAPQGTVHDLTSSVNTDVYTVLYHRRRKMGQAFTNGGNSLSNNDFKCLDYFQYDYCKKYGPIKLKFNDNGNFDNIRIESIGIISMYHNADGSPTTAIGEAGNTNSPVYYSSETFVEFFDM